MGQKAGEGREAIRSETRRAASHSWRCQVMVDGRRISVVDDDPEVAHAKALAIKTGMLVSKDKEQKVTVDEAISRYIQAGEGALSPTTIRGYETMRKHRFPGLMRRDVHTITRLDVQRAVSEEAKKSIREDHKERPMGS